MKRLYLGRVATAHIHRAKGLDPMIRVWPVLESEESCAYELCSANEKEYLGRILFDAKHYWVYDGDELTVEESEDLAEFILYASERANAVQVTKTIWGDYKW